MGSNLDQAVKQQLRLRSNLPRSSGEYQDGLTVDSLDTKQSLAIVMFDPVNVRNCLQFWLCFIGTCAEQTSLRKHL